MKSPFLDQDYERIRQKAYAIRHNYFDDMDKHLLNLESALMKKGIDVLWMKDRDSLYDTIAGLVKNLNTRRLTFDTQIPFDSKFQSIAEIVPVELAEDSSDDIDLFVVNADFAVSDSGSIVFLDRKSKYCFNKAKNMVVIVNIDQIIANQQDLSFFIALKYMSKEKKMPEDVKIIQNQLQYVFPSHLSFLSDQVISQEAMKITVILYLNDIEDIMSSEILKESLYCIECGRCLDVCPVASACDNISPIQLIKMNCLDKYNQSQHLFSHTTLCGACEAVCPVNIPLIRLMFSEMLASNNVVKPSRSKQLYALFSKRSKLNKANHSFLKYFFVKRFFGQNKFLGRYFQSQNGDFFNVTYKQPYEDNPNELIKDTDIE
ncbi:MAG: LUD domain-containing protein [Bacteroidales bacterium]|nr:LUD domain-containing protein [Bacteroidales bacterium]